VIGGQTPLRAGGPSFSELVDHHADVDLDTAGWAVAGIPCLHLRGALPGPLLSWVVAFWLTGASAFSLRLLAGWILAERLRSRMVRPASAEWQRTLESAQAPICVSRPTFLLN